MGVVNRILGRCTPAAAPISLAMPVPGSPPTRMLSPHYALSEFVKSQTAARLGIDNTPPAFAIEALRQLCANVLEPVRLKFGAVHVSSGYRCPKLNSAVGSGSTSQHLKGEAADFEVPGVSNYEVAQWIASSLLFDQLILENYTPGQPNSGWVHVSWSQMRARRQVLTWAPKRGYLAGLVL